MATATSSPARLYEAMFLLTPGAAADMASAIDHVREILTRGGAEIIVLRKWDDRRMAYAIRNQKRGAYIIAYFRAPTSSLTHIDRDSNLSERIVRSLITKADHLGETELDLIQRDIIPRSSEDGGDEERVVSDVEEIDTREEVEET